MSGTIDPRRALLAYAEFLKRSGVLYLEGPQEDASASTIALAAPAPPPSVRHAPPPAYHPAASSPATPASAPAHAAAAIPAAPRPAPSPRSPPVRPASAPAQAAPPAKPARVSTPDMPPLAHLAMPAPLPREERVRRLAEAAARAEACTACALHAERTRAVYSDGDPMARIVFLGEAPGAEEDKRGVPFVGAAGQLLDKMLGAIGFRRDEVFICNTLKCRPPGNRPPAPAEKLACRPFLQEQLELVHPQILVALGAHAAGWLTEGTEGIGRLRGRTLRWRGIPLLVTYHPAFLLRSPGKKPEAWEDMLALHKLYSELNPGEARKVWAKSSEAGSGAES